MNTDATADAGLPPLYSRWLAQYLGGPIPVEREATCAQCAMLCPEGTPARQGRSYFRADVKCCGYVPNLPNFLVGQTLADADEGLTLGRSTLERRIAAGLAVTPLGVSSGAAYRLLYRRSAAFGRSRRLRCPFYLDEGGGRCSIWRHRNSVCATFFCKFVRGAVGHRFWEVLLQLLEAIEEGLAYWCVAELGTEAGSLRQLFSSEPHDDPPHLEPADVDEVSDPTAYRAVWGNWLGREHEFYRACAGLVGQLAWGEVTAICGARVTLLARLVQAAYAELLSEEVPSALRVGMFTISDLGPDRCCISADGDRSLDVPRVLLAALPYFDGRPWPEAVVAVEGAEAIKLDRSLIRKLVDFDILVSIDATSATRSHLRRASPPLRTPET